jgi:hypothetical protein
MIFMKSDERMADGTDEASFEISLAAHEIEYLPGKRVFKKAVDGEVATMRVDLRLSDEMHLVGPAAVAVFSFASKRSDFNVFAGDAHVSARYEDYSKVRANGLSLWDKAEDLMGMRIGNEIVIFRLNAQKAIPHTTADK